MNIFLVFSLLVFSSCALLNDFQEAEFNWWGDPNFKPTKTKEASPSGEIVKPAESEVKAVTKEIQSMDQKAILTIDGAGISVMTTEGKMSYREGHSVDITLGAEPMIWKVMPSANKASPIIRFAQSNELLKKLAGKKSFKVILSLDSVGNKTYEFSLAAL